MPIVTAAQLQAEILDNCDMTNSGWPDSTQHLRKINRSISELYDLLVEHWEAFLIERCTIATDTAYDWIALPDGYYPKGSPACYKPVDLYYSYSGELFKLRRMNREEYERLANTQVDVTSGEDLLYLPMGDRLVFQGYPGSAFNLTLWYVPECPQLATLLLSGGESLDSSSWTRLDTGRDIVHPHRVANPVDGRMGGNAIVAYTSNATHGITQAVTITAAAYNLSCFFKAGAKTWAWLGDSTLSAGCYFNLSTGVVGTATSCTGAIEDWGNGWYRCNITVAGTAVAHTFCVQAADADTDATFAGDGSTISLYAWGAQLVQDSVPSAYRALTDSIDWQVPFAWTNYVTADVSAQLLAREESDASYWVQRKMEARQLIINAAVTRNKGNPVKYQRVYRRGRLY